MKKVMLLAPEKLCGGLRDALENKYITPPCETTMKILPSFPQLSIHTVFDFG